MTTARDHCTSEQIEGYLDGMLTDCERASVTAHIRTCQQCTASYESAARFQAALRRLPLERVSPAFTRDVMQKLNVAPATPLAFRLIEFLAYLFGMAIVVGIITIGFVLGGLIEPRWISEAKGVTGAVYSVAVRLVDGLAAGVAEYLGGIKTFRPGLSTLRICLSVVSAVGILFLVDRFVGRKVLD